MGLLLLVQLLQGPAESAAAQQLPHKRVRRADAEVRRREVVPVDKRQQENEDGPKLFVHWLILALVLFVPRPVIEELAQWVQNLLWLLEEQKDVQRERLGSQLTAQLLESHGLLIPAEGANDLQQC